jgi:chorismate mutase/prephenate dehydratase
MKMEKGNSNYRVAYLGPPATHTHLACLKCFGNSVHTIPKDSLQEVFETVEKGEANCGVVPVENSTEGSVNRTLDLFIESEVKICGEIMIQVSHDLLSQNGRREAIHKVFSHPQALEQCRNWLRKNLPHIDMVETSSTAKAAQIAAEDPESAAIANSLAAHFYRLKIIASQIEDYQHNYTRFGVLGHQMGERTGNDKTSILFSIPHIPGSLHGVLKLFSDQSINLTKIESRPMKHKPWEYIFFLDFEGHVMDAHVHEALTRLNGEVPFFKLLGSYARSASPSNQWWWSVHIGEEYPSPGAHL